MGCFLLNDYLKSSVTSAIYVKLKRSRKPIFCIVYDTIASKTEPWSQALHPIEAAYFHQSHLKVKQDYGHQAATVLLACNGLVLTYGIKKKLYEFATILAEKYSDFDFVTVKNERYYVFRYERKLNGFENAVILFTDPEKAFGNSRALRAFISTDISLDTKEILDFYVERWFIEVFFKQCKNTLALDSFCKWNLALLVVDIFGIFYSFHKY